MMPPHMTPATPLVCIGITSCVITQRVCSGVIGLLARSLLLLRRSGRLLGRLRGLDLALRPRLELGLALLAAHLPRTAIISASHRSPLVSKLSPGSKVEVQSSARVIAEVGPQRDGILDRQDAKRGQQAQAGAHRGPD